MIGGVQPKVLLSQDEDGKLQMIEDQMKLMGVKCQLNLVCHLNYGYILK